MRAGLVISIVGLSWAVGCGGEAADDSARSPSQGGQDVPPLAPVSAPLAGGAAPAPSPPAGPPAATGSAPDATAPAPGLPAEPAPSLAPEPAPAPPADADCYEFRAHGQASAGDATPWPVPNGTIDQYVNYTFEPPWAADVQAVSFRSLIDNDQVIHHWLLYQNVGGVIDAAIAPSTGQHPDAELLAGWAPGADDLILPPDVGMALGAGRGFTLELHYNNQSGVDHTDQSGVQVCIAHDARPNVAAIHWLGSETIFTFGPGDVTGTCSPNYDRGPITILRSWPHMHLKGTRMQSIIVRDGGGEEVLLDEPFDFNYQVSYDTPAVLQPGDSVRTTCTYNAPATYGPGTEAEMCYNFVLAYPAGSLRSISGLSANQNQCML